MFTPTMFSRRRGLRQASGLAGRGSGLRPVSVPRFWLIIIIIICIIISVTVIIIIIIIIIITITLLLLL